MANVERRIRGKVEAIWIVVMGKPGIEKAEILNLPELRLVKPKNNISR